MAAQTCWAGGLPAINPNAPFEIEDVASAKVAFASDEFCGRRSVRIVGNSAVLRRVLEMVRIVAPTDATVLINGETGTGKELVAEAIHNFSGRSTGPFVKVSCAAIPAALLESELFGHERGAYTGAIARSIGRFERAHRGTLFLDEIGDLPLELQPKILRVIQEGEFERLGSAATIHSDVRVICATHRNLVEMVDAQEFRADLFYRLSVFPIELPPLRERREDIHLLVRHFARYYAARIQRRITAISEDFMEALVRHSWPGNVRELQNLMERSVILSTGGVLNGLLPERPGTLKSPPAVTLKDAERSHIIQTLEQTEGVVGGRDGAAARLGLPRTTLIARMHRLGIDHRAALPARAPASVPISDEAASPEKFEPQSDVARGAMLVEAEREHIVGVVDMTKGQIAGVGGAAELLGVPPSTLRSRMKKLGIKSQAPAMCVSRTTR